ncbi:FHF complex subunit HOOK interacting protein 2A [Pseudolycoriella hygida]|uniref:FHF complex subunit HOOK interacting protein 2A n=1 Tax=Pseudolycoriella hygida TaxID=35572 RepID=A0A9Q0RTY3_9DIPT|nr:FHF complex subunit HOOK interacting protein 2A [Pseudolycoriella hygida]
MSFCNLDVLTMFGRLNEVLQSAADVLAPPPSSYDDFDYHWKQIKNFYAAKKTKLVHINDTNIPVHLEQMLKIISTEQNEKEEHESDCMKFVLTRRPLDLLIEFAVTETPPGATGCILNWIRRFLKLPKPHLDDDSICQPIIKLIQLCDGSKASPYEHEEILFLSTVAGLVRQNPNLINLFIPAHRCDYLTTANRRSNTVPVKNPLFDNCKIEANVRRISIVVDNEVDAEECCSKTIESTDPRPECDSKNLEISEENLRQTCDCDDEDRFHLLDTITTYLQSADNVIVVRSCEGAMILTSLPSLNGTCLAVKSSLAALSIKIAERLSYLCRQIPEDMDTGEIEDSVASWGLNPRDGNVSHFVGREQLKEFLSWLDYANCLSNECVDLSTYLCPNLRVNLLEDVVEPSLLDDNAFFMLVLASKIIRQIDSKVFSEEIAIWLIGAEDDTMGDGLLTILIENAQENSNILLPTLQFIESLLDNANERILNAMIFRYLNDRGYYDQNSENQPIQTWSDEEDERERLDENAEGVRKSRTLAPSNILRIINYFLLLLPRQIMSEGVGTCYEEYVQDANRHYQNWVLKTVDYNWPTEAKCSSTSSSNSTTDLNPSFAPQPCSSLQTNIKKELHCNDSGISEGNFYEGPLLRLLFSHVRNMSSYAYELNLAVIAILSKLAFLPHPYLHEVLLNPELPISKGTNTLWSSMQFLARQLLLEVPRKEGFQKKIVETAKNLLMDPPLMNETSTQDDNDPLFEALVVLEEFCKELAAIAFVKYHHGTTK